MSASTEKSVWAGGAAYESYVGRWSRLVAREFVDWLRVPPSARWLDVGCGTGALTEIILLQASPAAVHGIDPSEGYLLSPANRFGIRESGSRKATRAISRSNRKGTTRPSPDWFSISYRIYRHACPSWRASFVQAARSRRMCGTTPERWSALFLGCRRRAQARESRARRRTPIPDL
jgi:hypothetical protein